MMNMQSGASPARLSAPKRGEMRVRTRLPRGARRSSSGSISRLCIIVPDAAKALALKRPCGALPVGGRARTDSRLPACLFLS